MKNRQEWTDWAQKRLARKLATEDFDREVTAIGSSVARTGRVITEGSIPHPIVNPTGCAVPKATGKYPGTPCPYCGKPQ